MATVQLRRGTDTIDLYGGTDGYKIRYDGWMPVVAAPTQDGTFDVVDDVMTLRVDGSSTNDLSTKIQALDTMLHDANRYINRAFYALDPVYLRVQLDGESGARQALVYNGMTEPRVGFLGPPVSNLYKIHDYRLGITRHPFWESTGPVNAFLGYDIAHYGTLSTTGGGAAYNSVPGDVPARVNSLYFGAGLAGTGNYHECWAGLRSNAFGTYSNFQSRWDLGDSDISGSDFMHNGTARATSVSGAYNSQVARWTPGDTDLKERVTAPLWHMTSNYEDQRGTFLVLLRARVTSGGNRTFNVRLASGYYDSANTDGSTSSFRTGSRVRVPASGVSAGNWYFYPLGIVNIPPHRQSYAKVSLLRYFSLRIEAEVNSGTTGNLEMDIFTLIPIAEGGIHVKGTYLDFYRIVFVATTPDDEIFAHNTTSGGNVWLDYHKGVQFDPHNWGAPTGIGQVIVAAQEETSQTLAHTMQCWFDYYPRWKTLRGSE